MLNDSFKKISFCLFFLIGFILLFALGLWQWQRADQKTAYLDQIAKQAKAPSLALVDLLWQARQDLQAMAYRHVTLKGRFVNEKQLLLDNQFHAHRVGYHVLTPFQIEGQKEWILVDRGFINRHANRKILPVILPINNTVTLSGLIEPPGKSLMKLGGLEDNPGHWPLVVESIQLKQFSQELLHPLASFLVILDNDSPGVFERHWRPVVMMPERHLAYAFQWFCLAGVWLICAYLFLTKIR